MQILKQGWVFQCEHQLFPGMHWQCLAHCWWAETYSRFFILTLGCGRLWPLGARMLRNFLSSGLMSFFSNWIKLSFSVHITGTKSYQCGDCFQRGRSRLQTKHQCYRSSRRRFQGQVSSVHINTGNTWRFSKVQPQEIQLQTTDTLWHWFL